MNSELKYSPIYWKDGMVFSASQLESQYLAVLDQIKDATALQITPFNYGLLGGDPEKNYSNSYIDNVSDEKVKISHCRAVTLDGSRIEILDQNWDELFASLSELTEGLNLSTSEFWYIIVGTDPFLRIPDGKENPTESPRRKPFTRPAYQIELMSLSDLQHDSLANAIPVAKFERTASGLRKVGDYIPPCTRINSHALLVRKYEQYDTYLNNLKALSEKIVTKVKHKKRNTREQNFLADDIGSLCAKYLEYFVHHYDDFKMTYRDQPPIVLITFFAKMARILNHTMQTGNNMDHLMQYFREYATDMKVAELGRIFTNTFQIQYVHYDMSVSLAVIDQFLSTFEQILQSLERLDYHVLAKQDVVKMDEHIEYGQKPTPQKRKRTQMIIKRPGREQNIGDDLED